MVQIVPTLFATNEKQYRLRIEKLVESSLNSDSWVQIDLMDNKFVQNKSVGLAVVKKFPLAFKKEVQLMVLNPDEWINGLLDLGVDRIIFPVEIGNINQFINRIKSNNIEVGLSLNPETEVGSLDDFAAGLDAVLLMAVNPGSEGQEFDIKVIGKIKEIKNKWQIKVGVDGGIKDSNARQLIEAGADYLAIGSFLFEGNFDENLEKIRQAIK